MMSEVWHTFTSGYCVKFVPGYKYTNLVRSVPLYLSHPKTVVLVGINSLWERTFRPSFLQEN